MFFHQLGPSGPSWSKSRHVRMCVCLRHRMQFFFRPLIGPQITRPDAGLSLVIPPSLPYGENVKTLNLEPKNI